jgi:hypothetical protein
MQIVSSFTGAGVRPGAAVGRPFSGADGLEEGWIVAVRMPAVACTGFGPGSWDEQADNTHNKDKKT